MTKPWSELDPSLKGVEETRAQPWDPEQHFRKLSEADQRAVLGRSRYELWKEGKITLRDIPVRVESKVWGDHYRPKTLKELGAVKEPGVGT